MQQHAEQTLIRLEKRSASTRGGGLIMLYLIRIMHHVQREWILRRSYNKKKSRDPYTVHLIVMWRCYHSCTVKSTHGSPCCCKQLVDLNPSKSKWRRDRTFQVVWRSFDLISSCWLS
uniref:Uncharacterized protein n=1 Tax=Salix viminalis TaxID=40686 RepID=A0A6N2MGE6_SALVM